MHGDLRRRVIVGAANALGALALFWPFLATSTSTAARYARVTPFVFALVLAIVLIVAIDALVHETTDPKPLALMAALSALAAAVRPLGAGVAGLEPMWAVLLLGGRVLGPGRAFVTGAVAMLASAAFTGGVGPWLPYQMLVAAWVCAAPALLPRLTRRTEVTAMVLLGLVSGPVVGALLNLWFWPFAVGLEPAIAYDPAAGTITNIGNWLRYGLLTSLGFDLPRGVLTALLVGVATPSVLPVLRRAARRAELTPTPVAE